MRAVSVLEKNAESKSRTMSRENKNPRGTSSLKYVDPPVAEHAYRVDERKSECQGSGKTF
jgi:hypothetical protein